jgi:hypothetical protein
LFLHNAGLFTLQKENCMKMKHVLKLYASVLIAVLYGPVPQAGAVSIDGNTVSNGSGFKCTFQFNYIPANEDIGGIQLDIKTSQSPTEIIASAPDQGPWSQISPVLIRQNQTVSISAMTASFLKSNVKDPVSMFQIQLAFSGNPPTDIRKLIDTVIVKNAISSNGTTSTVSMSWNATSLNSIRRLTQPECSYIVKSHRVHQVTFSLKNECTVKARVIDANGKTVSLLLNSKLQSGIHSVAWDGSSGTNTIAASGIYFIQLETGSFTYNKKVSHLK